MLPSAKRTEGAAASSVATHRSVSCRRVDVRGAVTRVGRSQCCCCCCCCSQNASSAVAVTCLLCSTYGAVLGEHYLSVGKGSPRKRSLHGRGTRQRQERPAPFCRPLLATRHSNQDDRPCPLAFYPRGPGLAAFAQAEEIASLHCDKKGSLTELAAPRKPSKLSSSAQRVSARHANVVKRVCTGYPVAHRARATAPRHWTPLPARPLCSARRPASSARARVQRGAGAAVGQELSHDPACASRAL